MSRHVDAIARAYEAAARETKAARIAARVPFAPTAEVQRLFVADLMEATPAARAKFAADAGVKRPPSEKTWARVIELIAARPVPANNLEWSAPGRDPADAIT